jgi:hypothetical protein
MTGNCGDSPLSAPRNSHKFHAQGIKHTEMGIISNLPTSPVGERSSSPSVESGSITRISILSLLCALSALLLGCALQLSRGFFDTKALFLTTLGVVVSGIAISAPPIAIVFPALRTAVIRHVFLLAMFLFTIGGALLLHSRSAALHAIDVAIFESDSLRAVLHGANPYAAGISHRVSQTNALPSQIYYGPGFLVDGRVLVGFPYPPLTLLWMLPGYALGDIRWSFMLAVILTAGCMFYLSRDIAGLTAAILFLFVQPTIYVLTYSWTEPLMVLTLTLVVVAVRRGPGWLPLALGLFFASKQYSLLAVPLIVLLLPKFSWRAYFQLLAKALAVAAMLTFPFALPDPHGFWRSLIDFQLLAPFRPDALSLSVVLSRLGLHPIPQWFILSIVAAGLGLCLWKSQRTAAGFCAALAFVTLIFLVLNKQAFCNYYFFCIGALCLAIAANDRQPGEILFGIVRLHSAR